MLMPIDYRPRAASTMPARGWSSTWTALCLCPLLPLLPNEVALADGVRSPLEQSRPLRPGAPRPLEDYRFLDDPAKRDDPFDAFRYHRLSDSAWLQFGGELRYRADSVDRPFFNLRGVGHEDYLQQRAQLHSDLHLLDGAMRVFVQLEDTRSWHKELRAPTDQSRSEIHQAFVDGNWGLGRAGNVTARVGRQEMAYGSSSFVSYRESPNLRYSFDGVHLSWAGPAGHKADVFAVRPVELRADGSFNDGTDNAKTFYGLYASLPLAPERGLDLYGFSLETSDRRLAGVFGDEKRHTLGARLFGKHQGWDWSWDLAGQVGHLGDARIRAWALSSDSGYTWDAEGRPRLGMRIDMASGDDDPGDDRVGTFDPLFPRNQVYGEASLTTLANAVVVGPTIGYSPHPRLRVEPAVLGVWKHKSADGVYFTGMNMAPGTAGTGKRAGTVYKTNLRWLVTPNLTVDLDGLFYDVGTAITEAGGEDTAFLSVRGTFRF
ncbi:alginate export family protein [Zestomonas carbonaria]|uniref:Alginate export domain-containing protein n=1 Tax=Zestomonas carbonaria TaxID=2762745 RepID=A0A7U7ES04_9GAMM|nr:alginate export family protein [Pseudomonas carbonaria]CAD5110088.1 hypothetical protein PSEWESI4_04404 [Pseudomonas carbonaria]